MNYSYDIFEFGSSTVFFCAAAVPSKYINKHYFGVLKYIKKIFKLSKSLYFECTSPKNSIENLNSIFSSFESSYLRCKSIP